MPSIPRSEPSAHGATSARRSSTISGWPPSTIFQTSPVCDVNHRLRSGCWTTAVSSGSSTNFCSATLAVSSWAAGGGGVGAGGGVVVRGEWRRSVPSPPPVGCGRWHRGRGRAGRGGGTRSEGGAGRRRVPGVSDAGRVVVVAGAGGQEQRRRGRRTPTCRPEPTAAGHGRIATTIRDAGSPRSRHAAAHWSHAVRRTGHGRPTSSWRPRSGVRRPRCSPRCCAGSSRPRWRRPSAFLTGTPVQGRIGVGWATLRDVQPRPCRGAVADRRRGRPGDRASWRAMSGAGVTAARRAAAGGRVRSRHRAGAGAAVARASAASCATARSTA